MVCLLTQVLFVTVRHSRPGRRGSWTGGPTKSVTSGGRSFGPRAGTPGPGCWRDGCPAAAANTAATQVRLREGSDVIFALFGSLFVLYPDPTAGTRLQPAVRALPFAFWLASHLVVLAAARVRRPGGVAPAGRSGIRD